VEAPDQPPLTALPSVQPQVLRLAGAEITVTAHVTDLVGSPVITVTTPIVH